MKSISKVEQKKLDRRVKRKLKAYAEHLDNRPEAIINDPKKAKRVASALKKNGQSKLADEFVIATSKETTGRMIIEKMDNYVPKDVSNEISEEELVAQTKLNLVKVAIETVQGLNDMVSSRFLYEGARRARTVGRISSFKGPEVLGTGFMISPNLLMTNHHVLEDKLVESDCYVEFDYYYSKDNTRVKSEIFELRPDDFYYSNPEYDYAIVLVDAISDQEVELKKYGWNRLGIGNTEQKISDRLNIIHHPKGGHQQISIRKNYVVDYVGDMENEDIYVDYVTDTDYGSSGSPVYNDEWNIVALHKGNVKIKGEDKVEFLKNLENISKDLASEMRERGVAFNVGIKIQFILDDLRMARVGMSKSQQKLVDQIFESTESSNELVSSNEDIVSDSTVSKQNNQMNNPIAQNIHIHGGNVTLNLAHSITEEKLEGEKIDNKPSREVSLELYKQSLTRQNSIFKALDYVQKARELPYLPSAATIERLKEDYYGNIIAEVDGMNKEELYDNLSEKMQATFQLVSKFPDPLDLDSGVEEEGSTPSSYHKARAHIYTRIDLQPDGSLRGIYSNAVIAPEQLMLVDLINSLKDIDYELPKRYKQSDYLNCEHIVPKTHFDNKEEGYSDLHHLISADGEVNQIRNKNPFANLDQRGDDGRDRLPVYVQSGGWKRDGYFEPARGKGLVARATLYFIVAHPNFISTEVYSPEQIETLIEWSNTEQPTDYEKHRNETIYEVQGNRNPFIDFPDWVNKVDFEKGLRII